MATMNAQTTTLSAVSDALLTRRDGAVLVLSNNNVAARNALTIEFYLGVKAALQAAGRPHGGCGGADGRGRALLRRGRFAPAHQAARAASERAA
jgi:hypothetical protein